MLFSLLEFIVTGLILHIAKLIFLITFFQCRVYNLGMCNRVQNVNLKTAQFAC